MTAAAVLLAPLHNARLEAPRNQKTGKPLAMASQPDQRLPLFYNSIQPLSSQIHPDWGFTAPGNLAFARATHAIPLTVDEFVLAQRDYPVVFGSGPGAAPLALVGMADGRNLFVDADGKWKEGAYIPAYVRRYPYVLAKLNENSEELSLCFDDGSGFFAPGMGEMLFEGDQPSAATKRALEFCEQFEQAVQRTRLFMKEVEDLGIVIDGEVTINVEGRSQPAVYRGFRMVDENKLRELRGDQIRKNVQNGLMGMIYAHMFSLSQIRELFAMQDAQPAA